jgi:Tfp pilus assembly protein FimT
MRRNRTGTSCPINVLMFTILKEPRERKEFSSGMRKPGIMGECGFSVVEILTVVAIMLVLLAILAPVTSRQIRLHALDSSVSVIASKVREARMEALKRNRTSTALLDFAARTVQIQSTDIDNIEINVGHPVFFAKGVNLNAGGSVEISFDSIGRLTPATQVTVTLIESDSGSRKDIVVTPAGRVTVSAVY